MCFLPFLQKVAEVIVSQQAISHQLEGVLFALTIPLSEAREENPLVVEMLSSSCCERLSLISFTKEKPVEKGPGAEEVEGGEKRLLEATRFGEEASSGAK